MARAVAIAVSCVVDALDPSRCPLLPPLGEVTSSVFVPCLPCVYFTRPTEGFTPASVPQPPLQSRASDGGAEESKTSAAGSPFPTSRRLSRHRMSVSASASASAAMIETLQSFFHDHRLKYPAAWTPMVHNLADSIVAAITAFQLQHAVAAGSATGPPLQSAATAAGAGDPASTGVPVAGGTAEAAGRSDARLRRPITPGRRRSTWAEAYVIPTHGPDEAFDQLFKLDKRLASGGSGTVWSAIHKPTGTPVAVKIMMLPADETAEAFWNQREIDVMKTVRVTALFIREQLSAAAPAAACSTVVSTAAG